MKFRITAASITISLILSAAYADLPAQTAKVLERVPSTSLQMPQAPQSPGYKSEPAYGNLHFSNPVAVRAFPGETNRLLVVEQGGRIYAMTNLSAPNKTLFLDLSAQFVQNPDPGVAGLFALALHPGYQTNGFFFVGYNLTPGRGARVSRFSVSAEDPNRALESSELPLLNRACGDLLFGPDGYLYIGISDLKEIAGAPQTIDTSLLEGILRIDVDKRSGNIAPNPHPQVTTNYLIPSDNPFIGATNFNGAPVDPAKVRTELYAIGLRNPWRMSFDPLSGLLYVGDPGSDQWDEIDVIVKGGNYGWPYREGTGPGLLASTTPPGFTSIKPIYEYANPAAVIAGVVCRSVRYPQLQGALIFGDWVKGQISALRYEGTNMVAAQNLTAQSGVASFGWDPATGDVLIVNREGGQLMRLIHSTNLLGTPLPATLTDTGAFADLGTLTPEPGIVPYNLNVPFWSDNARKTRWFSVPNVAKTIGFNPEGNWSFPAGTVWIKHFELELTNGVATSARRLETRLLVRTATGVYGVTYRWGDSATNAVLVPDQGLDEAFVIQDSGVARTQVWHYPSRSECLTCHTPVAGYVLGFQTAQLNRDFDYPGGTRNQLRALSDAGYFGTRLTSFHTMPALANPTNTAISVDFRVRSYLAANCVQCHQPGGAALANFDVRLTTPLSDSGLMDGALVSYFGDADNRVIRPGSLEHSVLFSRIAKLGANHMPPLATSVLNQEAIDLLSAWITGSATNYQSYADWQQSTFGSTTAPGSFPTDDPDGDGASNELEFLTGTNPLSRADTWRIEIAVADGTAQVDFPRLANRRFEVQWTSDLSLPESWQALDVPGNEPLFASTNSTAVVQDASRVTRFYRVRVFEP